MPRARQRPPESSLNHRWMLRAGMTAAALMCLLVFLQRLYHRPEGLGEMLHRFVAITASDFTDGKDAPTDPNAMGPGTGLEFSASHSPSGDEHKSAEGAHEHLDSNPPSDSRTIEECTEIDKSRLAAVKDRTLGNAKEAPLLYHLLCVAANMTPDWWAAHARRDVFFSNLFHDPAAYRGEPIHLKGVLSRLTAREDLSSKNDHGFDRIFEAWIFTENQVENPVVVLLSKVPMGLEPSIDLRENVELDAFFFKLFAFQTGDQTWHAAPLFVGKTLKWIRVETGNGVSEAVLLGAGFVAILSIAAVSFWWLSRRDEHLSRQFHATVDQVTKPGDVPFFAGELFENDAPSDKMENRPSA
ncbi:MAG: hypothetical protein U1D30_04075 [Planctomycetota bacterium]